MKQKLSLLLSLGVFLVSCKKELQSSTTQQQAPVVNVREVLTKQAWKLKEIRALKGNTLSYYLRDGKNNTVSFDKEYILFKNDKTGTYFDGTTPYSITSWEFKDSALSQLVYNVSYQGEVIPVTWEHLQVTADSIRYDEFFTRNNQTALSVATRVPFAISNPQ